MSDPVALAIYFAPVVLILGIYLRRQRRQLRTNMAARDAALTAGMTEPPSLHPLIDPVKCIGCGACIAACPEVAEHNVLGLIHGKAELLNPADCIGHGACLISCPVGAITLVFGTERRGVEIPNVGPDFQTNVPGIFIAGELGGMGLIRNAIEQGRQAVDSIRNMKGGRSSGQLDVVIIGAGPAGFSASLAAMEHGLKFVTLEQETLGGTVAHYPRGKLVMTAPAVLPLVGKVRFKSTTKEELLGFWENVQRQTGVPINYRERAKAISRSDSGFAIQTDKTTLNTRAVLLAIGRRGTPQKLGVPGEHLPKVVYRLIDPEQYRKQRVLVVGGGDSALECACSIAAVDGTEVALSYRADAFSRAKQKNRDNVSAAAAAGRIRVMLSSNLIAIEPEQVRISHDGREIVLPNDAVLIHAGGVLPTALLRTVGVQFEMKHGTA